MPFTFSHPAVILPLLKRRRLWLSATGLIIGSLTPDFEAFIDLSKVKVYGHLWLGIFWFDLPLCIIVSVLFHAVVRDPFIENLPLRIRAKFEKYLKLDWVEMLKTHFWRVVISMVIGITSHLIWDAITHLDLQFPDGGPTRFKNIRYAELKLACSVLQWGCSVVGLLVVALYIYRLKPWPLGEDQYRAVSFWPRMSILFVTAFVAELLIIARSPGLVTSINLCISSFFLALFANCLFVRLAANH